MDSEQPNHDNPSLKSFNTFKKCKMPSSWSGKYDNTLVTLTLSICKNVEVLKNKISKNIKKKRKKKWEYSKKKWHGI